MLDRLDSLGGLPLVINNSEKIKVVRIYSAAAKTKIVHFA